MGILWEGFGMGARTIHEHPDPDAPFDSETGTNQVTCTNKIFFQKLYDLGVRYIRDGGTDPYYEDDNANPGVPNYYYSRAKEMRDIGLHVVYGACYVPGANGQTSITPNSWQNHKNIHSQKLAAYYAADAFDVWSIGNEQDNKLTTVAFTSFVRTSNVVTATSSTAHGFKAGEEITSAGATPSNMNVTTTVIDVPTPTTLTFAATGTDGSATGTLTIKWTKWEYSHQIMVWAAECRVIAPTKEFIYSLTADNRGTYISRGINPGVDLDYIGMNSYGSSATNLSDFRGEIQEMYNAFGSRYWITEWNLNNGGIAGDLYNSQYYTRKRLEMIRTIGVSRSYFFLASSFDGSTTWASSWECMSETNLKPRGAFYELFSEKKKFYINELSSQGSTDRDVVEPKYAVQKNRKQGINLGKCIDFSASNSKISFPFYENMDPVNMPRFTVAVTLFIRTLGGANSGRIIDSINQRFLNLFVSTNNQIIGQMWTTGTFPAAQTATNSIPFNQWFSLFFDWNDLWSHPRMYIDCKEQTTNTTNKSGSRATSSGQIGTVGNRSDSIRVLDGKMDNFYIFGDVLTPRQKNSYMNGRIPRNVEHKMAWTFEEVSGDIIDQSGNNVTGTPSNLTQNVSGYVYP